jgi:eukaryotic-like serine/threonine-protein kinase
MELSCSSCAKTLEFSGDPPRFCSYCGESLAGASEALTVAPAPVDPDRTASDLAGTVDDDMANATIGGYRLLRRLGGGGMGAVYEAEEIASGRRVALKLILPDIAGSGDALVRFRREGRLASALSHPRCVFVLAADEEAGRPYIVMELMPGSTLADLVRDHGPLPPDEAVAKILDVIDGLIEAHRRGLVHRDVKPSNCFLEANGRVKIGDFGLARSLVVDTKVTRTGAFVGTPLYAAPEQIHQKDTIDAQSDVYSVAATLYFLLTGQAPFQSGGDAMATLARIVTESPPPMRSLRPDLPRALDKVVLRGLERDRRRRFKNLDQLQSALSVFLPARPSVSGLGLRFGGYLIDVVFLVFCHNVGGLIIVWLGVSDPTMAVLWGNASNLAINLAYYGALEGIWGCSLGKRLVRLRVGTARGAQPPGIARAALRCGSLFMVLHLGNVSFGLAILSLGLPMDGGMMTQEQQVYLGVLGVLNSAYVVLSIMAVLSTMRRGNGYRGLHEFISGTRTYHLRWPRPERRRTVQSRQFDLDVGHPEGMPMQMGPYRVRGALSWTDAERTLLAQDASLDRTVWIWLRPVSLPPLDAARRDINRATRIRWVAYGTDGPWQWDAFLAPAGMPLPVLAAGPSRLNWGDVRPLLEDLAEELAASCAEGTLPPSLTPDQVWVQPDGRVQLLGTPLTGAGARVTANAGGAEAAGDDEPRALHFLREVAVMALEGSDRPVDDHGDHVRAPLPVHAAEVLDRLMGERQRYGTAAELRADLDSMRDRPATVSRLRRAAHLALMILLLQLPVGGFFWIIFIPYIVLRDMYLDPPVVEAGDLLILWVSMLGSVGFWIVWAFVFRGGFAFWHGGIALRRADGRKASRLQCAFRAFAVWAPVVALIALSVLLAEVAPSLRWLYFVLWGAGVLLLFLYVPMTLINPTRGLHDWIAGTYLVPD